MSDLEAVMMPLAAAVPAALIAYFVIQAMPIRLLNRWWVSFIWFPPYVAGCAVFSWAVSR